MASTILINTAITLLTLFGFLGSTYGGAFARLPDSFESREAAFSFGLLALLSTVALLWAGGYLSLIILVFFLQHLNIW